MPALSSYLENALLNHVLRHVAMTSPTTVYLAAYSTNPTANDSGTEVTGGSYARQAVSFSAPASGVATNSADINFASMPAVTVTYLGIRDAITGGNLLFFGALTAARVLASGDTFTVRAGDLNVSMT